MKRGVIYTVVFMLALSLLLTTVLALADKGLRPVIERNAETSEKAAILDALGLAVTDKAQIDAVFLENIAAAVNARGQDLYVKYGADQTIEAIAVPFTGAGLWGQIQGYLAVAPDLSTIVGVVFTEQNETPGLGGRIEEARFRDKFRGLVIVQDTSLSYDAPEYSQLDAIAGATSSSRAVLRILNSIIENELPGMADGLEVVE